MQNASPAGKQRKKTKKAKDRASSAGTGSGSSPVKTVQSSSSAGSSPDKSLPSVKNGGSPNSRGSDSKKSPSKIPVPGDSRAKANGGPKVQGQGIQKAEAETRPSVLPVPIGKLETETLLASAPDPEQVPNPAVEEMTQSDNLVPSEPVVETDTVQLETETVEVQSQTQAESVPFEPDLEAPVKAEDPMNLNLNEVTLEVDSVPVNETGTLKIEAQSDNNIEADVEPEDVLEVEQIPSDSWEQPADRQNLPLLKLDSVNDPAVDDLTPVNEIESAGLRVPGLQSDEEDHSSLADVWCDARDEITSDESSLRATSALSSASLEELASQVISEPSERFATCEAGFSLAGTEFDLSPDQEGLPALEADNPENVTVIENEPEALDTTVVQEVYGEHSPVSNPNGDTEISPSQSESIVRVESSEEPEVVAPASDHHDAGQTPEDLIPSEVEVFQEVDIPTDSVVEVPVAKVPTDDEDTDTENSAERMTQTPAATSGRRGSILGRGVSVCEENAEGNEIVDYLVDVQNGAEARLAARRQARAEAREIRMKELEKQQKESEENADRQYDMYSSDVVNRAAFRVALGTHPHVRGPSHSLGSASYHSSRRSSEESSEDGMVSIRDMRNGFIDRHLQRHELKEMEEKFRKSMVQNAQLDNEKSALTYHVELLKDKIEDLEEALTTLQRDHKDKSRDYENLKRLSNQFKDELEYYKSQLQERDELIKEYGLVVVENEFDVDLGNGDRETRFARTLVAQQTADVLSGLGNGSLDVRLKRVLEEKNELLDELRRLKLDLEEERSINSKGDRASAYNNISNSNHTNGPDGDTLDAQRETSKQMAEYKFRVQKYEQEITTLQANVARLDGQVSRFKTTAEEAEAREDDLKVDKRKLQRELREAQSRLDELETTNSHLQKRLDKLKTAKSALLKDL